MSSRTIHVILQNGQWAVKKDDSAKGRTYSTQKEAIGAARKIVRGMSAGQIVVHGRDGSIRIRENRGLPAIQKSPVKSTLGRKAIERAVSTVILERLLGV